MSPRKVVGKASKEAINRVLSRYADKATSMPHRFEYYGLAGFPQFTAACDREQEFSDALRERLKPEELSKFEDFLVPVDVDPVVLIVRKRYADYYDELGVEWGVKALNGDYDDTPGFKIAVESAREALAMKDNGNG